MFGLYYLYGAFANNKKSKYTAYNDKSTKAFSLDGKMLYCRVVSILDGDTIKVVANVFKDYYKFTIRLNGLDTCEKNAENEEARNLSLKAKNRLIELITKKNCYDNHYDELNKNVHCIWIKCYKNDKYGRILADLYYHDFDTSICLNQILLNEKLAYCYKGKTKLTEDEQVALLNA